MAVGFILVIAVLGFIHEYPKNERLTLRQALRNVVASIPSLSVPVVMIGSIVGGLATPTEAAAVGAAMAVLVGRFAHGEMKTDRMGDMLLRVAINSGVVLALVAAAAVFGWVIIYEQLPQRLGELMQSMTSDPFVYLLLLMGLLLMVGMVLDGIAALILLVPIVLPVAQAVYGINPYHLGVLMCINLTLGLLTPPVGAALYVASRVTGCKPGDIIKALLPFLLVTVLVLLLITWMPDLVTAFL
ncbi:Sialic acid TRAP transporter permease protein SiaT [Alcanivorax sp. ALC70]|nr:Sialic acid TRAP transporter permease protein SiaT [Alcanivorax sp. ALC70]